MKKLRVSEFMKKFAGLPYWKPGEILMGKTILPFSIFECTGDPRVFYMDTKGFVPEFQLVALRDGDLVRVCVVRLPAVGKGRPHLITVR